LFKILDIEIAVKLFVGRSTSKAGWTFFQNARIKVKEIPWITSQSTMTRILFCGLSTLLLLGLFPSPLAATELKRIYVSVNGKDSNNGTIDQPLATLEAAQKTVRAAKKSGLSSPIEIVVGAGVYFLQQTLEFTPEDSGTKEAPITWKAAAGQKVVLSGGRPLKGKWQKDRTGFWYIEVPASKGWKRDLNQPESYAQQPASPWNFRQLYVNGKRATRARFPNANENNPFLYAVSGTLNELQLGEGLVKKSWANEPDAQLNVVPRWRFFNQWNDVSSVDPEKSSIQIGPREQHGEIDKGTWFWIEGVKAELDQPGEWYLDHEQGRLYYQPIAGEVLGTAQIIAPYLNRIFYVKGDLEKGTYVQYLSFQGFNFQHTTFTLGQIEARVHTDCAVMFENAQHCSVTDSHFEHIGGYALWLHLDSRNNVFDHNTVVNSGGGGVLLTGARLSYMDDSKIYSPGEKAAKVFPILNRITRNSVENCGKIRYYGGGVHIDSRPTSMAMEPGNYIAHNHFRNLSRNGIFAFRNQGGNVVEFNEIHDCMQTTIDGAAIHFATMNRLSAPNFILNNYLYDIWGYEQLPSGNPRRTLANGVFLDWATSNTTVRNNVIYNAGDKEIKPIMENWNLVIENNLASKTNIAPFFPKEIGPLGTAAHCIYPEQLKNTGAVVTSADKNLLRFTGNWEKKVISGFRNLFNYTCLQAAPGQAAQCTYQLPVSESGLYKVCLMYFPDEKNASNARVSIQHADGVKSLEWNFRKGDKYGFALRVGEFYFDKDQPASLTISNENADGALIADGVGFIKMN
jgi:Right handed beta helix region